MENKTIEQPKNLMLQKILWVLLVTAVGAGIGYLVNNITACTIGGLIGGSFVFFYKKKK